MAGKVVGIYVYKDAAGKIIYRKERIEPGRDGQKKYFRFSRFEDGKWTYDRNCDPTPYNLPTIVKSKTIFFTEGEGKADLLTSLGFPTTSLDAGAGSSWLKQYDEFFKHIEKAGIFPDNDESGEKYAHAIANELKRINPSIQVKIIRLEGLPEKGDIVNWFELRKGKDKEELKNELKAIIKNAPWDSTAVTSSDVVVPPHKKTAYSWPSPISENALVGLAGDFVRTIEPHTEASKEALLIQFLVAFGNMIGGNLEGNNFRRGSFFQVEADQHHTNLFCVLIGETGRGRKGTSWGHVRNLFTSIEPNWCSNSVKSGLSSGEGVIYHVRDRIESTEDNELVVKDDGVLDKRLLIIQSEFAAPLKIMKREDNILSSVIREAWDSGSLRTLTKNSPVRATGAHVSIIGHITREDLIRYLDATDVANGFANRFLWACTKRSKILPEGGSLDPIEFETLISKVRVAVEKAKCAGQIQKSECGREYWKEIYPQLTEDKSSLLGALTSRSEAQVIRLGCLYALLDQANTPPLLKKEHLLAAQAVWEYCEASTEFVFGDLLGDPVADQIYRSLKGSEPEGMTRTQISNLFQRHQEKSRIDLALGTLINKGRVKKATRETGGRSAEIWLIDTAKKAN